METKLGNLGRIAARAGLALLLAALAGAGCQSGDRGGEGATEERPLAITVIGEGGAAIEGAEVALDGETRTTDAEGRALFHHAAAGRAYATIRAPGFAPTVTAVNVPVMAPGAREASLLPLGERRAFNADEEVDIIEPGAVRVTIPPGSFIDADGSPVRGMVEATLVAIDPNGDRAAFSPALRVRGDGGAELELAALMIAEISFWKDGAPVNLAPGRTARVELALPEAAAGHFDVGAVVDGYWLDLDDRSWRRGSAGYVALSTLEPSRTSWVSEVSHFTFWSVGTAKASEKNCVNVKTVYVDSLDPKQEVGGVRVQIEGIDYLHVGGITFTNSSSQLAMNKYVTRGQACLEYKKGGHAKVVVSSAVGYKVLNEPADLELFGDSPASSTCDTSQTFSNECPNYIEIKLTRCGDGKIQEAEQCDDGNASNSDACTTKCKPEECGDGYTQGSEECDSGASNMNTGACKVDCTLQECGDGFVGPGEQCDNGLNNGNGANATCTLQCTVPECGDGITQVGEECDQGAANSNSGFCKTNCTLQKCGDGFKGPGEACDDGNKVGGDGCSAACSLEACGNGVLDVGEQCDDGALNNIEGPCTPLCMPPKCGDGLKQIIEQCDTGAQNSVNGACTDACKNAVCGDGKLWTNNEQCDNGAQNSNTGACKLNCKLAVCGDGFVGPGETCDDGNQVADDGCTSCQVPGAVLWTKTYNGAASNQDRGYSVAVDAGGNALVAGMEYNINGNTDIWVGKYAPNGSVAWTSTYDGPSLGNDRAYAVATCSNGDIYVAGYSFAAAQGYNIWVGKLAAATGSVVWTKTYDGLAHGDDYAYAVACDAGGNALVSGTEFIANSPNNIWTARLSGATGAYTPGWPQVKSASIGYSVVNTSVVVDSGGNLVVTAGETPDMSGLDKVWYLKYNPGGGVPSASKNFSVFYRVTSTTFDPFGFIIAAGYAALSGQNDIWVEKFDTNGAPIWQNPFFFAGPSSSFDAVNDVVSDSKGNLLLVGYVTKMGEGANIWVGKLKPSGTSLIFSSTYNSPANTGDYGYGVASDASGNTVATGYDFAAGQSQNVWIRKFAP